MSVPDDKTNCFGINAAAYARYRPLYPEALFDFLADEAPDRALAWDAATGNGQAATALASRFDRVLATDVSPEQIGEAIVHPKVHYQVSAAESPPLHPASASLITVAQAAHWFDLDRFYPQVKRVLRPGGVIAIWCYSWAKISPGIDAAVERLAAGELGPYWSPKNQLVVDGYRDLPFPFDRITTPAFTMEASWTLAELEGYLRSWSASQAYQLAKKKDPVETIAAELKREWGPPATARRAGWELTLFAGRSS